MLTDAKVADIACLALTELDVVVLTETQAGKSNFDPTVVMDGLGLKYWAPDPAQDDRGAGIAFLCRQDSVAALGSVVWDKEHPNRLGTLSVQGARPLHIIATYLPGQRGSDDQVIRRQVERNLETTLSALQRDATTVVVGDFNARLGATPILGRSRLVRFPGSNPAGEALREVLERCEVVPLFGDEKTGTTATATYEDKGVESTIDYVLTRPEDIDAGTVRPVSSAFDLPDSVTDHALLVCSARWSPPPASTAPRTTPRQRVRCLHSPPVSLDSPIHALAASSTAAATSRFVSWLRLHAASPVAAKQEELDDEYAAWCAAICSAYTLAADNERSSAPPDALAAATAERRQAANQVRSALGTGSEEALAVARAAEAKALETVKEAVSGRSRDFITKLAAKLSVHAPQPAAWDVFKELKETIASLRGDPPHSPTLPQTLQTAEGARRDTLEVLTAHYAELLGTAAADTAQEERDWRWITAAEWPHSLTTGSIQQALARAPPDKAPGADGIRAEHLQGLARASSEVLEILTHLTSFLRAERAPELLRLAVLVPIPKGRTAATAAETRPIALASHVRRVLDGAVFDGLTEWTETWLHDSQFGFRPHRSTSDAVALLLATVQERRSRGLPTYALFVDLKSAYDCVSHDGLLLKLRRLGMPAEIASALDFSLRTTSAAVRVGGVLGPPFPIRRGVPQGAAHSPALFAAYLNDLLECLSDPSRTDAIQLGPTATPVIAYADDLVLLAPTPAALERLAHLTEAWGKRWGMTLNLGPGKTEAMVFHHFRTLPSAAAGAGETDPHGPLPPLMLTIGGQQVTQVREYTYLGFQLRDDLNPSRHFEEAVLTASRIGGQALRILQAAHASARTTSVILNATAWHAFTNLALPLLMSDNDGTALEAFDSETARVATMALHISPRANVPQRSLFAELGWTRPALRAAAATLMHAWRLSAPSAPPSERKAAIRMSDAFLEATAQARQLLSVTDAEWKRMSGIASRSSVHDALRAATQHCVAVETAAALRSESIRRHSWALEWKTATSPPEPPTAAQYLDDLGFSATIHARAALRLASSGIPRHTRRREGGGTILSHHERLCWGCSRTGNEFHVASLRCPVMATERRRIVEAITAASSPSVAAQLDAHPPAMDLAIAALTLGTPIDAHLVARLRSTDLSIDSEGSLRLGDAGLEALTALCGFATQSPGWREVTRLASVLAPMALSAAERRRTEAPPQAIRRSATAPASTSASTAPPLTAAAPPDPADNTVGPQVGPSTPSAERESRPQKNRVQGTLRSWAVRTGLPPTSPTTKPPARLNPRRVGPAGSMGLQHRLLNEIGLPASRKRTAGRPAHKGTTLDRRGGETTGTGTGGAEESKAPN